MSKNTRKTAYLLKIQLIRSRSSNRVSSNNGRFDRFRPWAVNSYAVDRRKLGILKKEIQKFKASVESCVQSTYATQGQLQTFSGISFVNWIPLPVFFVSVIDKSQKERIFQGFWETPRFRNEPQLRNETRKKNTDENLRLVLVSENRVSVFKHRDSFIKFKWVIITNN